MPRYTFPVHIVVVNEKRRIAVGYLAAIGDMEQLTPPLTVVDPDGVLTITQATINTVSLDLDDPCGGKVTHPPGTVVLFTAEGFERGSLHEVLVTVETTLFERLSDTVALQESEYVHVTPHG